MGTRNHEIVPIDLIVSISKMKLSKVKKISRELSEKKLLEYDCSNKCK